jgi:hypothetical protein
MTACQGPHLQCCCIVVRWQETMVAAFLALCAPKGLTLAVDHLEKEQHKVGVRCSWLGNALAWGWHTCALQRPLAQPACLNKCIMTYV